MHGGNVLKNREITVDVATMLHKLRSNRAMHANEYEDADLEYKQAWLEAITEVVVRVSVLQEKYKDVDAADLTAEDIKKISKGLNYGVRLQEPESHVKDYDDIITMFDMEVSDTVKLPYEEFRAFVLDEWDWKERFNTVKASYSQL